MFEKLERLQREYAREYVIRVLRHNIINMNLKPGQLVSENEIAEKLGVSRTPVREAFIELSRSSLVEIYPQKGTCISPIDMDIVEESRFMRCVMEKAVVQFCCDVLSKSDIVILEENLRLQDFCVEDKDYKRLLSLDNSFHELLFRSCQKEMTFNLIKSALAQFDRVRILNFAEMDMQITVDEHKKILRAIKNKDKEVASDLMEKHLTRIIFDMSYLMEKHPEYFKRTSIQAEYLAERT
ncbi:Transcriptional regulator, GntR family [Tepidanaerobacter acetatoxydans Re1]|uniref:Transcriptional regulator, GntR family n=1 Tax=Tepidanaerobacter acetatoxydans (strain DSM 21804 / JCM 16047 / Re1) TaxID=1209989 RepID=F4LX74_TEPAE|nr:GntR family transcriptional regulator [Tepidanaerobacter acetatoxydans]AEE91873.1 transcriptional regulator, GntR family [Tepidanaerobacter acetatoxydans Re1]CCP26684.1 Transcriptional regulator, GntR family [Tepidanaerobacter acetatoxydans Re1]